MEMMHTSAGAWLSCWEQREKERGGGRPLAPTLSEQRSSTTTALGWEQRLTSMVMRTLAWH